jgi:hypothetical protein
VTEPLFAATEAAGAVVRTLELDQALPGGLGAYQDTISDHRPVLLKVDLRP